MDFAKVIEAVVREGQQARDQNDAIAYNFLPSGNKQLKKAEAEEDKSNLISVLIAELEQMDVNHPASRHLLSSLMRLVPYRDLKKYYLSQHRSELEHEIYPKNLAEVFAKFANSDFEDIAIAAMNGCQKIGLPRTLSACLDVANTARNNTIKKSAILNAVSSAVLNDDAKKRIKEIFYTTKDPHVKLRSFDVFFADDDEGELLSLVQKNPQIFEDEKYLEAFFDLSKSTHSKSLQKVLSGHDVTAFHDELLRKIVRHEPTEAKVRTVAKSKIAIPTISRDTGDPLFGLLIHRNSNASAVWIGHAGIYIGNNEVIHVTTGHDPQACHRLTLDDWKSGGGEFWGFRADNDHPVDIYKAVDRAMEIASWRTKYDGGHNNQKGEWFNKCVKRNFIGFCVKEERDYWEADCVGFAEHIYEYAGGNPTDGSYESGFGWPLTPREQRDSMLAQA